MSTKKQDRKVNPAPKTAHHLEFVGRIDNRAFKSEAPFIFDNKPVLLDPTLKGDQVVMLLNGEVVYQGLMPSALDFERCMEVISGLRFSASLPDRIVGLTQVGLVRHGEVLLMRGCPAANEYNEWEKVLNELRVFAAIPTL